MRQQYAPRATATLQCTEKDQFKPSSEPIQECLSSLGDKVTAIPKKSLASSLLHFSAFESNRIKDLLWDRNHKASIDTGDHSVSLRNGSMFRNGSERCIWICPTKASRRSHRNNGASSHTLLGSVAHPGHPLTNVNADETPTTLDQWYSPVSGISDKRPLHGMSNPPNTQTCNLDFTNISLDSLVQ
jgi:hypothetical protein